MTVVQKGRARVPGGAVGRKDKMQIPRLGPPTELLSGGGTQESSSSQCGLERGKWSVLVVGLSS